MYNPPGILNADCCYNLLLPLVRYSLSPAVLSAVGRLGCVSAAGLWQFIEREGITSVVWKSVTLLFDTSCECYLGCTHLETGWVLLIIEIPVLVINLK
jgi:hypothetical protein